MRELLRLCLLNRFARKLFLKRIILQRNSLQSYLGASCKIFRRLYSDPNKASLCFIVKCIPNILKFLVGSGSMVYVSNLFFVLFHIQYFILPKRTTILVSKTNIK